MLYVFFLYKPVSVCPLAVSAVQQPPQYSTLGVPFFVCKNTTRFCSGQWTHTATDHAPSCSSTRSYCSAAFFFDPPGDIDGFATWNIKEYDWSWFRIMTWNWRVSYPEGETVKTRSPTGASSHATGPVSQRAQVRHVYSCICINAICAICICATIVSTILVFKWLCVPSVRSLWFACGVDSRALAACALS